MLSKAARLTHYKHTIKKQYKANKILK